MASLLVSNVVVKVVLLVVLTAALSSTFFISERIKDKQYENYEKARRADPE